ncbi:hypothetical protein ACFLRF_03850 [Candidatus Altiarchaeota archaeon]
MNRSATILMILCLATQAAAWGQGTHSMLCEQIIASAWGKDKLECLAKPTEDYCIMVSGLNDDQASTNCHNALAGGGFDLRNLTDDFFGDLGKHMSYTSCPLWEYNIHKKWLCPSIETPSDPAGDKARQWLEASCNAEDECLAIQAFCTAALYYSDGAYPIYQMDQDLLIGCIGEPLEKEVDEKVLSGGTWNASQSCQFLFWKQKVGIRKREDVRVTVRANSLMIDDLVKELSLKASETKKCQMEKEASEPKVKNPEKEQETSVKSVEAEKPQPKEPQEEPKVTKAPVTTIPEGTNEKPSVKDKPADILPQRRISSGSGKTGMMLLLGLLVLVSFGFIAYLFREGKIKGGSN